MYKIFLTNHGYYAHVEFDKFEDAVTWAREHSFQVMICQNDLRAATWCPINGLTDYRGR